jgi:hypothetical protein
MPRPPFALQLLLLCCASPLFWSQKLRIVTPGVIIGGGRIGLHLFESNAKKDKLVSSRNQAFPLDSSGPIYVCTRNDALESIITATPTERRQDLVFLQNGMLTDFLEKRGLQDNTQALIYYAIAAKGDTPIDGKTDVNPEGLTAVTGKWAEDFALRMHQAGLACHVYDKDRWTVAMVNIVSVFLKKDFLKRYFKK